MGIGTILAGLCIRLGRRSNLPRPLAELGFSQRRLRPRRTTAAWARWRFAPLTEATDHPEAGRWHRGMGLNHRHAVLETAALPLSYLDAENGSANLCMICREWR
jgi:hypothetical protein